MQTDPRGSESYSDPRVQPFPKSGFGMGPFANCLEGGRGLGFTRTLGTARPCSLILRGGRPDSRCCQDHPTSRRQECRLRQRCLTTINTRINQYLNPAGALGIRRGRSRSRELPWYAENPSLHQCKRVHVDQSHTLIRGSNPSRKVATPNISHIPHTSLS